jgi:hypothetical protein
LVPGVIGDAHTFVVRAYKGIGRIPAHAGNAKEASGRFLLDNLSKLLRGYGKTFAGYGDFPAAVILICDLDDKCLKKFRAELFRILDGCRPKPETGFCIAIEEGEAWFLGDLPAIKAAFPKAKGGILASYVNDSICGTWEKLADAVYPGGSAALIKKGWVAVGIEKSKWAESISPHIDIAENKSPSFRYFIEKLRQLAK